MKVVKMCVSRKRMRDEDNNCEVDEGRKRLMCFKVEYMEIDERWIGFKSSESDESYELDSDDSESLESDESYKLESESDESYELDSDSDESLESDESYELESDDIINGDNIISKKVVKKSMVRRVHIGWGNYRWILD